MYETTVGSYAERFEKVFEYIDHHLGEDLSIERLSRVASFSRFHFQRQFAEYAGISAFRYIQLTRLKRASYRLAFTPRTKIIDIAYEAGFENPESFARAFKAAFGQTPTQFRKSPAWKPWNERFIVPKRERTRMMDVRIVNFARTEVAALEHRGAPQQVFHTVRRFIEWRKANGLSPVHSSRTFNLAYSDPETTAPEDYRVDICGSVTGPVPDNPQGVVQKVIPEGRCAVVRHVGSHDRLGESVGYLYREWLPESGEEIRDFPLVVEFLSRMPDTPEHEQQTDIYLPLK